ncbi:MAG TPA: DNA-binding domain-containing protein [Chlamydiales bacterium]|jgi:hypothetical protein|nr:DNA-binding domain-containing protein [Chlamydiales bacterium]
MYETAPPALEELQLWFAKNLTRPFRETGAFNLPLYPESLVEEIRKRIAPGPHLSAEQRFGLYNQQYWWRLFVLLQESFPSLVRLFGYRDFNTLIAEPYLLRYPPTHWFLPRLGDRLVRWLREEYWEEDRELLFQLAQLDAAYESLFHIGTNPLPSQADLTKKLSLQPTVALFQCSADFLSFRSELLKQDVAHWQKSDLPGLNNAQQKYYFVLFRGQEGILHEALDSSQYALLQAFQGGSLVEEACAAVDPSCAASISDWFKRWMERGFFSVETVS